MKGKKALLITCAVIFVASTVFFSYLAVTEFNDASELRMEGDLSGIGGVDYDNQAGAGEYSLAPANESDLWFTTSHDTAQGSSVMPPKAVFILAVMAISGFGVIVLFARLSSEDIMGGVRGDIYQYISNNPGEHLAEITRNFNMSSSSARYHLYVLETTEKIVSYKTSKHKHYYVNKNGYSLFTGSEYKQVISTLKNDTTRDIVKYLFDNEGTNQKSISEALSIHPSTVNWHANRLGKANIINRARQGKDIIYHLNENLDLKKVINLIERPAG